MSGVSGKESGLKELASQLYDWATGQPAEEAQHQKSVNDGEPTGNSQTNSFSTQQNPQAPDQGVTPKLANTWVAPASPRVSSIKKTDLSPADEILALIDQSKIKMQEENYREAFELLCEAQSVLETDGVTLAQEGQNGYADLSAQIAQNMGVVAPILDEDLTAFGIVSDARQEVENVVVEGSRAEATAVKLASRAITQLETSLAVGVVEKLKKAEEALKLYELAESTQDKAYVALAETRSGRSQLKAMTQWRGQMRADYELFIQNKDQLGEEHQEAIVIYRDSLIEQGKSYVSFLNNEIERLREKEIEKAKNAPGSNNTLIPGSMRAYGFDVDNNEIRGLIATRDEVLAKLSEVEKKEAGFLSSKAGIASLERYASLMDTYQTRTIHGLVNRQRELTNEINSAEGHGRLNDIRLHLESLIEKDSIESPAAAEVYLAMYDDLDYYTTGRAIDVKIQSFAPGRDSIRMSNNLTLGLMSDESDARALEWKYRPLYKVWSEGNIESSQKAMAGFLDLEGSQASKNYRTQLNHAGAVNLAGNIGIIALSGMLAGGVSAFVGRFATGLGVAEDSVLLARLKFATNVPVFWGTSRWANQSLMEKDFYDKGMSANEKIATTLEELVFTAAMLKVVGGVQSKYLARSKPLSTARDRAITALENQRLAKPNLELTPELVRSEVQRVLWQDKSLGARFLAESIGVEMAGLTGVAFGEAGYKEIAKGEYNPLNILNKSAEETFNLHAIAHSFSTVIGLRAANHALRSQHHNLERIMLEHADKALRAMDGFNSGGPGGAVLVTPSGFKVRLAPNNVGPQDHSIKMQGTGPGASGGQKNSEYAVFSENLIRALKAYKESEANKDTTHEQAKSELVAFLCSALGTYSLKEGVEADNLIKIAMKSIEPTGLRRFLRRGQEINANHVDRLLQSMEGVRRALAQSLYQYNQLRTKYNANDISASDANKRFQLSLLRDALHDGPNTIEELANNIEALSALYRSEVEQVYNDAQNTSGRPRLNAKSIESKLTNIWGYNTGHPQLSQSQQAQLRIRVAFWIREVTWEQSGQSWEQRLESFFREGSVGRSRVENFIDVALGKHVRFDLVLASEQFHQNIRQLDGFLDLPKNRQENFELDVARILPSAISKWPADRQGRAGAVGEFLTEFFNKNRQQFQERIYRQLIREALSELPGYDQLTSHQRSDLSRNIFHEIAAITDARIPYAQRVRTLFAKTRSIIEDRIQQMIESGQRKQDEDFLKVQLIISVPEGVREYQSQMTELFPFEPGLAKPGTPEYADRYAIYVSDFDSFSAAFDKMRQASPELWAEANPQKLLEMNGNRKSKLRDIRARYAPDRHMQASADKRVSVEEALRMFNQILDYLNDTSWKDPRERVVESQLLEGKLQEFEQWEHLTETDKEIAKLGIAQMILDATTEMQGIEQKIAHFFENITEAQLGEILKLMGGVSEESKVEDVQDVPEEIVPPVSREMTREEFARHTPRYDEAMEKAKLDPKAGHLMEATAQLFPFEYNGLRREVENDQPAYQRQVAQYFDQLNRLAKAFAVFEGLDVDVKIKNNGSSQRINLSQLMHPNYLFADQDRKIDRKTIKALQMALHPDRYVSQPELQARIQEASVALGEILNALEKVGWDIERQR